LLLSAGLPNWVGQGWSAETPKGPLRVLLVDGQQNKYHNWKATTPAVTAILQDTGRFQVDALTTPPAKVGAAAWTGFRPDFRGCDVVLLNYHGEDWPGPTLDALEGFVRGGGGLVAFHAGGSSFEKRESFNRMLGLAWRNKNHGAGLALTDDGSLVRLAKGEGYDAGHGPRGPFVIRTRQPQHPVMQGWPPQWSHVADELWHWLRGPAENLEVLATAFSPATGRHEPMVWTVKFGRGRVFVTALGHNVAHYAVSACLLCWLVGASGQAREP